MALREINLVDIDILFRQQMRRHLLFWAGCLVVCLALLGGFHLLRLQMAFSGTGDRGTLAQVDTRLNARFNEIKTIQEELEHLRQQQDLIEAITKRRNYYTVLVALSDTMNPDTWITNLDLNRGKDRGGGSYLRMTGLSQSNEKLGDFLNRLSGETIFDTVVLKYARESGTAQSDRAAGRIAEQIQFQIECRIPRG
ncbi:PilN domain-containing protein [Thermodesulfobacteriota bacterium]